MSLYLVSDFGYELRDVAGTPESIFYKFIGAPAQLTAQELEKLLDGTDMDLPVEETVDLLVWYGFLGIMVGDKPFSSTTEPAISGGWRPNAPSATA